MKNIITLGFLLTIFSCWSKQDDWRNKPFDSLDFAERDILSYDSVYGNYIKWVGTNSDSVTYALHLDKPNKFAVKCIFEDTTGFFSKIPGNIGAAGQWTELNGKFRLRFYHSHADYFDSLTNDKVLRTIDNETIELDKDASTIWIMKTGCKRQDTN